MVECQTAHQVQKIQTDNGGEYINKTLQEFFKSRGIIHETTAAYSLQLNSIAERLNQTITTTAHYILRDLPKSLWAEAIAWSVYMKN